MNFSEFVKITRELIKLFEKIEPRSWSVEAMATELAGEVGTLCDSIMIRENFRSQELNRKIDIEDDIADILFMLIRIADYYEIDIENEYKKMINETKEKLINLLE